MKTSRRETLKTLGLSTAGMTAAGLASAGLAAPELSFAIGGGKKQPNVLFIPVDDLRPQLGCYGHPQMISPNIDRLASEGTVFEQCFCQVPVCGASRASLLSGIRPNRERFLGFSTKLDEDAPGALSLPRHFKNNGYHTVSTGKVFHHRLDNQESWSEEPWRPSGLAGQGWRNYLMKENIATAERHGNQRGPAFEIGDVDDNAYHDGLFMEKTLKDLRRLKEQKEPFFIANGFLKPHLPFNAPREYWDLYNREEIDLADNPFRPKGAPDSAMHNWGELRNYAGIPPTGPLPEDLARTLVQGYYACVSYTDALVGKLLDELERTGLRENTVIALWGDHGWNLGEHGLWCKHCNFETSLHSPLLISAPGMKANRTRALTEFVDIYPTLCDLCGIAKPEHLEGASLEPLMKEPGREWKSAAFSRYFKGDSIRTKQYRYTEWTDDNGAVYDRMLYDHHADPHENTNIAELETNKAIALDLSKRLKSGWKAVKP